MDKTSEQLVDYTLSFAETEVTDHLLERTTEILFDSICCAVAGSATEPALIATNLARAVQADQGATVFGHGVRTTPELAAFANSIMVRTHDYNDFIAFRDGHHPSDMISGILAAGEIAHASGREVLTAIALSYEVLAGLGYDTKLPDLGFDQGLLINVAVALAAGQLWHLDGEQLANAASLALVPNLPLRVVRRGALAMTKCATAFSVRNGVFAAMLARDGFTSAPEPFAGIFGLEHLAGPITPRLPMYPNGPRVVDIVYMKPMPAGIGMIGLLEEAVKVRDWLAGEEVESIDIDLKEGSDTNLGAEAKYDPKTRETADHSLPFLLARTLVDGEITLQTYTPERIADPALRPLMRKVRVHGSKEMSALRGGYEEPPPLPGRIRVRTTTGREYVGGVMGHRGHPKTPMSRADLDRKLSHCAFDLAPAQVERIRAALWDVAESSDVGDTLAALATFRQ